MHTNTTHTHTRSVLLFVVGAHSHAHAARTHRHTHTHPHKFIVTHLNLVLARLDGKNDPEDHDQLIIPIIINGNHWTLLIIDLRPQTQHVYYFDSLGGKIDTRLQTRLTSVFPTHTLFVLNQQLQFDGFQCGVWVCLFISLGV